MRAEANDDEIIAAEAFDEIMSAFPYSDARANDSLEEINHQHPTLRAERNDDESIITEASNEGTLPLPPLETHANEKIDSLEGSKINAKKLKAIVEK